MKPFYYIARICIAALIYIVFSNMVFAESTNGLKESDYDKLCEIYRSVVNESTDLASKEMKITEEVQLNLPVLFDNLFIHIIKANADKRYQLISQYARQQNKVMWSCEAARSYYANQF